MVKNMATYPGMSLGGEVRESISLDEDDLSDVEDEVFIRDGKNGYKFAEELNVKRPLMAPRRRIAKSKISTRLTERSGTCKKLCRPLCYGLAALSIVIGLMALVVVLVSIFPLPMDKFRDWIITKSNTLKASSLSSHKKAILPCSSLNISKIWSINLPILSSDSPIRFLNIDDHEFILFGFGTTTDQDQQQLLPEQVFCPIFIGVPPPCQGGVLALNGSNGEIIWRYWLNDKIYSLICTNDVNNDNINDCLVVGIRGSILVINPKNGSVIWNKTQQNNMIFIANFIQDVNNDSVSDVIAVHTSFSGDEKGFLVLLSGKNGEELKQFQLESNSFFMPQLFTLNNTKYLLFGTGSPNTNGKLNVIALENFLNANNISENIVTIYKDSKAGILTQALIIDITNDNIKDLIISMYNSTIIAFNGGRNFQQIWNYTIPLSESNAIPTPAYFNDDNITDFLIIYQKYDNILNDNYTLTYIIDGKNGLPIYSKPIMGAIYTQMSGLTLKMENFGYDLFVFWTLECRNQDDHHQTDPTVDYCKQSINNNSTFHVIKLNALNQYDQPPGFEIFNSIHNQSNSYNTTKSPLERLKEYLKHHSLDDNVAAAAAGEGQNEIEDYNSLNSNSDIKIHKYESERNDDSDYDWRANQLNLIPNQEDYPDDNPEYLINNKNNLRDPRSKNEKTRKKDLADNIYNLKNMKLAKNRILHDLNNLPTEILKDTYFKNRERELRKSKFEERDINNNSHKDNKQMKKILNEERKKLENSSLTLWDLESEKELEERENGLYRGKRDIYFQHGQFKINSPGIIIANKDNNKTNFVDIIFITYWQPNEIDSKEILENEIENCIHEKFQLVSQNNNYEKTTTDDEKRYFFESECRTDQENLEKKFPYFNQVLKLRLGTMSIYRLRVQCMCTVEDGTKQTCAKFSPQNQQIWPEYMGSNANGIL